MTGGWQSDCLRMKVFGVELDSVQFLPFLVVEIFHPAMIVNELARVV